MAGQDVSSQIWIWKLLELWNSWTKKGKLTGVLAVFLEPSSACVCIVAFGSPSQLSFERDLSQLRVTIHRPEAEFIPVSVSGGFWPLGFFGQVGCVPKHQVCFWKANLKASHKKKSQTPFVTLSHHNHRWKQVTLRIRFFWLLEHGQPKWVKTSRTKGFSLLRLKDSGDFVLTEFELPPPARDLVDLHAVRLSRRAWWVGFVGKSWYVWMRVQSWKHFLTSLKWTEDQKAASQGRSGWWISFGSPNHPVGFVRASNGRFPTVFHSL